jgi:hypothetical protein
MFSFKRYIGKVNCLIIIGLLMTVFFATAITIKPVFGGWWDNNWQYRKMMTIDHTRVASSLNNFPVLVDLVSSDLASNAQADGDDIVFTDNVETKLDHEIESYNNTDGHLVTWVNANLSSTVDTMLYLYYGNPGASNQENPLAVWDSGFKAVWHFDETSGTVYDSTSNNNDGTYTGSSQNAAGKIDGTDNFDGTDDCTNVGSSGTLDLTGDLTIEAWIYPRTWGENNWGRILGRRKDSPAQGYEFVLDNNPTGGERLWFAAMGLPQYNSYSTNHSITLNTWQHVVVTRTSTTGEVKFYVNGMASGTGSMASIPSAPGVNTFVGIRGTDLTREFNGLIDELRASNSVRSPEWISTEYNNQNSPGTLYTVGPQETSAGPDVTDPDPAHGATNVSIAITQLSFSISHPESNMMNYSVTTSPSIGSDTGLNVFSGSYNLAVSGLSYGTTYTWRVNVTDGTYNTSRTFSFKTRPDNYAPTVSNPSPPNAASGIPPLDPTLTVYVADTEGDPMNVTFSTNSSGTWQDLQAYVNVDGGTLTAESVGVIEFNKPYYWRVTVTDGKSTTIANYSFTTLGPVQDIGTWFCWGNADIGRSAQNSDRFYITFQYPDGAEHSPYYAEFDRNLGWIATNQPVCDWSNETIQNGHPFMMYYNDQIHLAWSYGGDAEHDDPVNQYIDMITANTFDDFHSMVPGNRSTPITEDLDDRYVGNAYSFSNDLSWHFGRHGNADIEYWTWSKDTGWSIPGRILTQTSPGWGPCLLPMNRTHFFLYYHVRESDTLRYVESFDGGQTWGAEQVALNNIPDYSTRISFARYGDKVYLVLLDNTSNHVLLYNSTDGKTWNYESEIYNQASMVPAIATISQTALLWTASNLGLGKQVGGVYLIPEMLAYPQKPTDPYPADASVNVRPNSKIDLSVVVHGPQTYDIAFYWANGTFIGEDKLLCEGERATVTVSGLQSRSEYEWYTISRGTSYDHWGNEPDSTTDEVRSDTWSFTFSMSPPKIFLSNPIPEDGGIRVTLNPELSIYVDHVDDRLMNVAFETDTSGSWQTITSYSNVGDGTYKAVPVDMNHRGQTYHWRVTATEAANASITTTGSYSFTLVNYVGQRITQIGVGNCWKIPYIRPAAEENEYIVIWSGDGPIGYARYDLELGWIETNEPTFASGHCSHPTWGYWDDAYHVFMDGYFGNWVADSSTWEGFSSIDFDSAKVQIGYNNWQEGLPAIYCFNNSYAWLLCEETDNAGTYFIKYYEWKEGVGWGYNHGYPIFATNASVLRATPALLMFNETTWYLYFVHGARSGSATVRYIKSMDGGKTWGPQQTCAELSTHHQYSRLSLTRYGNNFYIFLVAPNGDAVAYYSSDMEHWGNKITVKTAASQGSECVLHHGAMLHQSALLSAMGQLDPYTGPVWGVITVVPEMMSNPGIPNNPQPFNDEILPMGTTSTRLQVRVHGSQVYDVAFYRENGSLIGVDRLLQEGDTASLDVSGLVNGETHEWYAIARGATYDYTGAEPASTSDEERSPVYSFTVGTLSKLQMSPIQPVCQKFCEQFNIEVDVKDVVNVTDFAFEIQYDAPLLEYVNVTWGDFLSGTGYMDYQAPGLIRGHITPGTPATGNGWLLNLTFYANSTMIWKDFPGWVNKLEGRIWFHWANLSRSVGSDLRYEEGVSYQIEVNEVNYTYLPIQGDVDSDGEVSVFDLRTVSAYYNAIEGDPAWTQASKYDLNGDDIIDIFDIVKIARNYGFKYES